jgi:putative membrane protein
MKRFKNYLTTYPQQVAVGVVSFFLIAGVIQVAFGIDYVLGLTTIVITVLTSIGLLFWEAPAKAKIKASLAVIIASYFIELIGVKTGLLFGDYTYSGALGYRIFGVPFTIGLTWLFVTLSAWHIALINPKLKTWQRFLLGGLLVVMFDLVLEQFAVAYGLWAWAGNVVPLYNYVTWFFVSIIFFAIYRWFTPKTQPSLFVACLLPMVAIFFWFMLLLA